MLRKLLLTSVASLALLSPLAFTSVASAHDFWHHDRHGRREVARRVFHVRRPIVRTVQVVPPAIQAVTPPIQIVPVVVPAPPCR